ncbi:MAG: hypothetical protein ACI8W7_004500 [Gammaproteobacteria bacterium]
MGDLARISHLIQSGPDLARPLNLQHIVHACQYSKYYRRMDNAL